MNSREKEQWHELRLNLHYTHTMWLLSLPCELFYFAVVSRGNFSFGFHIGPIAVPCCRLWQWTDFQILDRDNEKLIQNILTLLLF